MPLWAGAPASHLSRLHAVEIKVVRVIGISRNEAESWGLSLSPQAGRWSFSLLTSPLRPRNPLLCLRYVPPYFRSALKIRQQPPSGKTAKIKNHCSPSLFSCPIFGTNSHTLFNPTLPSRSSKQLFTTISYLPPSKATIFSTPTNPPQTHLLQIPCFPS